MMLPVPDSIVHLSFTVCPSSFYPIWRQMEEFQLIVLYVASCGISFFARPAN